MRNVGVFIAMVVVFGVAFFMTDMIVQQIQANRAAQASMAAATGSNDFGYSRDATARTEKREAYYPIAAGVIAAGLVLAVASSKAKGN
jgi:hypothetical protein